MQLDPVELVLTCGSWQEAQTITDALLAKKLVACVEQLEGKSKHWWKHVLETDHEVKLIMTSVAEKFDAIEAEIKRHHSYETFVLQMWPITKLNNDAIEWFAKEVGQGTMAGND